MILRKLSYLTLFWGYSTNVLTTYYYGCPLFCPYLCTRNPHGTLHWLFIWVASFFYNSSLKFEITAKRLYAASQRVL